MTLGELIARLESADPTRTVRHGFTHPHSYRGYYNELAFEPASNVTVADMLADARSALGTTYEGWKGGDFAMHEHTDCWLSEEGCASGDTISALLVELMLGVVAVDTPALDAASGATSAPLHPSQPSSVSESAQSPTGAPEGALRDPGAEQRDRRERYAQAIHDAMEPDLSLVDQEPACQALFARAAEAAVALADTERAAALREDPAGPDGEQQAKARCGHDIETALGTYPCERDADHDGDCDERTEAECAAAPGAHHTQENPR